MTSSPVAVADDVTDPARSPLRESAETPTRAASSSATEEEHDALIRLEEQVQWLRQQFLDAEQEWEQERRQLMQEVTQRQEDCQLMASDIQHLEQEQQPLLLLQERANSVLDVLRNLRHVNISTRALGRLVYDALERCQETDGGQAAFRFLNALHRAASGYERLSTESLIQLALEGLGPDRSRASNTTALSTNNLRCPVFVDLPRT
ncbi:uncharacterized protein LOC119113019 [Pollicipes pollicipes]|uniref:uncharacterized protein LOC119113019 n=1 Tax=Pollicipes pollicipes TaxID=41117 RepID=UPI00188532FC|nr:uncharacterized protein LOC119113019 [Pollicipes pollicipes]